MSKFIKTVLSNFSNLFQTNDNNTTINTNAYTIPSMHQENNEKINNDAAIDFDSLFGSTENITVTNDKDSNNSDESKSITPEGVGATIAVGTTSILSGVAKVDELIADGIVWVEGKKVEGVSWLVGEVAGLFSEDAKNSIMKWREDVKKGVKSEIERDLVGELNEWFYENTKIGQDINEASYLKYDSEAAKTTQNITTKVTEIGGATALTILTGGAAAPLVFGLGCAEGIGKTAEKTYQNGGDFDDGTFSILLSGGLNGMSWVANGKLVQGAFEIIKDAASVGLLETGSTLLNDTLLNKEFWSNTIKNGLSLKTMSSSGNSVINVNALMNYGSSLMSIGGDFVDVLNSDEGFTPKNIMSLGKKYLVALGLNVLEDSGREYLSAYKSGNITTTPVQKNLVDMTEAEIHSSISKEIAQLDQSSIDYQKKVQLLQEKEQFELELVKKISGTTGSGKAPNSIDIIKSETQKQQVKQAAQEVFAKASSSEPSVTASMKKLTDDNATLEGLEFKIKPLDSIEDKIARRMNAGYDVARAQSDVYDSLRYTLVVSGDYQSTVLSKLKMLQDDGFEIDYVNNAWGNLTYKGLNVTLKNSDGLPVELQFHTPSSFNTKQFINHELYELSRNPSISGEVQRISRIIQKINQELYVGNETRFGYEDKYSLRTAVANFSQNQVFQELYDGMKKYSVNKYKATKQMAADFGDAGSTVTDELLYKQETVQQVLNGLHGAEKRAFIDFLNNTVEGRYIKSLTDDELRAITRYTGGDYSIINNWLREGKIPNSEKSYIATLDSAIAKYGGIDGDTQLFRGIGLGSFTNQKAYEHVFDGIDTSNIDEVYAALKGIEGGYFTDAGYISTSPSYQHSFAKRPDKRIVLDIVAEDGTKGAYINQISKFYNSENEFLLAAGTKLKMVTVEAPQKIDGQTKIVIKCQIVK